jgi:hypothetical protein
MKLYERFGDRGFHTSIVTSFCVDFEAYEDIALPRLRGAGCHNNLLLLDDKMLREALDGGLALPRFAGRWYSASGVTAKSNGVFHPKIVLQIGRGEGRIIVSSANMTSSGLAGNLELAGSLECTDEASPQQQIIAQVWQYAKACLADAGLAVTSQLAWAEARTPWLRRTAPATGAVTLADGTVAAFLTPQAQGIGAQLVQQLDGEPVKRLVVFSPYWDDKLDGLKHLIAQLTPAKVALLVDTETGEFPVKALGGIKNLTVHEAKDFCKGRFFHAKAVIAETQKWDHVLYGSANCTVAALGKSNFAGINHEACLYKRLPARQTLDALGLASVIDKSTAVDAKTWEQAEAPDDELAAQNVKASPGRFECHLDILSWYPPDGVAPDRAALELLDLERQVLDHDLTPLAGAGKGELRYRLAGDAVRPAFARLRCEDGSVSALAIVSLVDVIRQEAREQRSRSAEQAALRLADETEAELLLLDVFDALEAAEARLNQEPEPASFVGRRKKADEKGNEQFRTLDYESFIAGRRPPETSSTLFANSLAGSELSLVRNFLNRIIGLGDAEDTPDDEDQLASAFNLGDETSDPDAAMAAAGETGIDPSQRTADQEAKQERQRLAAQRKASRAQIAQAATQFVKKIGLRKQAGALTTLDILRLRALLMIVVAAGHGRAASALDNETSSLQVLPREDSEESWPRLIGRILFGVFDGADPAIGHVQLETAGEHIAEDILECWATCFWCVQAAFAAPRSATERKLLPKRIGPLMDKIYVATGLTALEYASPPMVAVMTKMNERFCARLGLDAAAQKKAHDEQVQRVLDCQEVAPASPRKLGASRAADPTKRK